MESKYKAIIMDFDGTLGDTFKVIIQTIQATIKELELPSRTDIQCTKIIGIPLIGVPPVLFPECKDLTGDLFASTYRRIFPTYNRPDAVTLFPHVRETLSAMHKKKLILTIASSRSHESLVHYINDFRLNEYISYIIGADDVTNHKPHPEPVNVTLKHLNLLPSDAVVVGDASYDILMGRNAGCTTCGVTYGNDSRYEMERTAPDYIIDDISELLKLI